MTRRLILGLFAAVLMLPTVGCWHRRVCRDRDSCSDRYYTPSSDYNR